MQSCGMQQENEVPTQNIMEMLLYLRGPTKYNTHVSRTFLSFTARKITGKVNLPKRLLVKLQPFFVDVTVIVLMQQIHILELSNQVLKLVCFKDLK